MIFNEDKLEKEIIRVWGEFGSHNEVFQNMKKKITHKQKLDNDVLIQNKSLIQDGANNTISISSSLYYSKAKYDTLYIFPSSSTNYLDTSSKEDYYYIINNEQLDIIGTGETQDDAEQNFNEEFDYLYNRLNSLKDNQLNKRLLRVRYVLNSFVKEVF